MSDTKLTTPGTTVSSVSSTPIRTTNLKLEIDPGTSVANQGNLVAIDTAFGTLSLGSTLGPGTSVSGDIVTFNGTSGSTIADSGILASSVVVGPASAVADKLAAFSGTTGKLLKDSGLSAASFTLAPVGVPASASAAGTAGTWSYDATHIYVCVASGTWVRATLATW